MRQVFVIAVVLCLSVPAYPATPSPPDVCDGRQASVVPGLGIGPIKIGEDIRSVLTALQAYPLEPFPQDPGFVGWGYRDPNIIQPVPLVLVHHDRIVELILNVNTPEAERCFTPAGIRLGSLEDAIRAAYGDPPSTLKRKGTNGRDQWIYNGRGIAFTFDPAWSSAKHWPPIAMTEITVFQPGQFCEALDLWRQTSIWGIHVEVSCAEYAPPP
jgi:hypothetical protein